MKVVDSRVVKDLRLVSRPAPPKRLEPCLLLLFGATGDLARRKLFPALFNLHRESQLPRNFAVIGLGRRIDSEDAFRELVLASVRQFSRATDVEKETCAEFLDLFHYRRLDIGEAESFAGLGEAIQDIEADRRTQGNRIFYLAVAPENFGPIVERLAEHGIAHDGNGWRRIVIEKPFGRDRESAQRLNQSISEVFPEEDIFRIDHYLGKEMLQNIMVIRFANSFFEPVWNNRFVDNVQISVTETDGVGTRGRYYERAGALRDMLQNHLMQLLSLTAMEPPVDLDNRSVRDEKMKVIRAIERFDTERAKRHIVRGQYGPGVVKDEPVIGYRSEENVAPDSDTETFVAATLFINNFRWAGVPFYLRTGKRLARRSAEIVVQFKSLPGVLYAQTFGALEPNVLVIKVQPEEGVFLQFNAKEPGTRGQVVPVKMDYCQNCLYPDNTPEAYERLIRDVILGDPTLFTRWDEVESAWALVDTIAEAWQEEKPRFPNYQAGTWGPREADELLRRDGRQWWVV